MLSVTKSQCQTSFCPLHEVSYSQFQLLRSVPYYCYFSDLVELEISLGYFFVFVARVRVSHLMLSLFFGLWGLEKHRFVDWFVFLQMPRPCGAEFARLRVPVLVLFISSMNPALTLSQLISLLESVLTAAMAGCNSRISMEATNRQIYKASSNLLLMLWSCSINLASLSMCLPMLSRDVVYRIVTSTNIFDIRLAMVCEMNRVLNFSIISIGLLIHDLTTWSALSPNAEMIMLLACWHWFCVALHLVSFESKVLSSPFFGWGTLSRPFALIAAKNDPARECSISHLQAV